MIQLGTNSLGIGLAIHLRDKFTARSRAIESEFKRLHGSATRVMEDNLRVARRVSVGMIAVGAGMTLGFNKALHTAADFEHVMKTLELVTNANTKELAAFDAMATKLGTNTIFSPQEIASGMEFLAKAGFKAKHILGGTIQAVTYLGAALDKPVGGKGGVADQMTHIMQGFNIGPTGASFVADMITKTALASSSDLEDIHEALKYVSATAVDLNISLPETLAMIAKLSNAGLRGGIGGRSLNNMLLQLARSMGSLATPKHKGVLKLMGLDRSDILDKNGNLKRISDVIAVLSSRLKQMPPIERVSALSALLNIRGARAVGPLLRDTGIGGSFDEILLDIQNSKGLAEKIAIQRMDTLWGSFERLKDTVWNFFKTVGTVLKPIVKPLLDFSIKLIAKFTEFIQTPLGKPLVVLVAAGGLALIVMGSLLFVFTSIKLMSLASTVSFTNMGRSLVLAWTQGTAAALRYMTTAKGAMLVNTPTGARWRSLTTGRFVKGPAGTAFGGGMFGWVRGLSGFLRGLFSAGGALSSLGTVARTLTGPIGWIVGILGALVGFKNIVKLVVFGLGTLLNALIFAGQVIWAVVSNPFNPFAAHEEIGKAKERYKMGQEAMMESLGLKKMTGGMELTRPKTAAESREEAQLGKMLDAQRGTIKRTTTINLDGRKVGELTHEEKIQELKMLLSSESN